MDLELALRHRVQVEGFRRKHRTDLLTLLFTDIVFHPSQDEIGRALDVSEPTIRRHWAIARAWLYAEMKNQPRE